MELTINKINDADFKVTGNDIDCKVWYINNWSHKLSGKGSRKHKDAILEQVEQYIRNEERRIKQEQEQQAQAKNEQMKQTELYKNIGLLTLYEVGMIDTGFHAQTHYEHKALLTGYEIKNSYISGTITSLKDYTINNTDIYAIGSKSDYQCKALVDERIFAMSYHSYVTGLALKEMLANGLQSYERIRRIDDIELRSIQQYGSSERTVIPLFDFSNKEQQLNNKERYIKELQRAERGIKKDNKPRYTNDGIEIHKAWFSSKPMNLKEAQEKEIASYSGYAIMDNLEVDYSTFTSFTNGFDMNVLPITFEGGTSSNFEDLSDTENLWGNTEYEQEKWIAESYVKALKLTCKDLDYALLIDPQGYDYARYVAVVDK